MNFFIIIGVYVVGLYIFALCLLILLNDYKNIYSRNNNVCVVVFMCINTFKILLLVSKGVMGVFSDF